MPAKAPALGAPLTLSSAVRCPSPVWLMTLVLPLLGRPGLQKWMFTHLEHFDLTFFSRKTLCGIAISEGYSLCFLNVLTYFIIVQLITIHQIVRYGFRGRALEPKVPYRTYCKVPRFGLGDRLFFRACGVSKASLKVASAVRCRLYIVFY